MSYFKNKFYNIVQNYHPNEIFANLIVNIIKNWKYTLINEENKLIITINNLYKSLSTL